MQSKITTLKIRPHFEYRVWAGNKIKKIYNFEEKSIGEAWIISAYKNKSSIITNLEQEISLLDFYNNKNNANFFNNYNLKHEYPLLTKIIDAKQDLSVQIHPDNEYAKEFNSLGKTECWYILDTNKNNSIVLGHNANSLDEFKNMVENKEWKKLLKEKPIKKGDFIYVESTKIHAIKSDTLIFELQQSSDITYRVYDYGRLDNGKPRELHLDHVYKLVKTPDVTLEPKEISNKKDFFVANNLFNLQMIKNKGKNEYHYSEAQWVQICVIEGKGKINNIDAKKFDCFLVAHNQSIDIDGNLKCLVSFVK